MKKNFDDIFYCVIALVGMILWWEACYGAWHYNWDVHNNLTDFINEKNFNEKKREFERQFNEKLKTVKEKIKELKNSNKKIADLKNEIYELKSANGKLRNCVKLSLGFHVNDEKIKKLKKRLEKKIKICEKEVENTKNRINEEINKKLYYNNINYECFINFNKKAYISELTKMFKSTKHSYTIKKKLIRFFFIKNKTKKRKEKFYEIKDKLKNLFINELKNTKKTNFFMTDPDMFQKNLYSSKNKLLKEAQKLLNDFNNFR